MLATAKRLPHHSSSTLEGVRYSPSTMHMYTLSICTDPKEVLYTATRENGALVCIQPYTPLFAVPRLVTAKDHPILHGVVGEAHDLFMPLTDTGYDVGCVRAILKRMEHPHAAIHNDTPDDDETIEDSLGYRISGVITTCTPPQLVIPNNNFLSHDILRIDTHHCTVQHREGNYITLTADSTPDASWINKRARIVLSEDTAPDNSDDISTTTSSFRCLGIIGHTQSTLSYRYSGCVSIATVIHGYTPLAMSEDDGKLFRPGSRVYLLCTLSQKRCIVSYRPSVPRFLPSNCYAHYLGIFIEHAHTNTCTLGYICFQPHSPLSFPLIAQ